MINWLHRQIKIWQIRRHYRWVRREHIVFLHPIHDPRSFSEYKKCRGPLT